MVELAVRLVFSLAVVVGLLLVTVKMGARRFRPRQGAAVRVVHRQALSRSTAVAVVEVGGRTLVLGTTEHQVNVLAELEDGVLDAPDLTLVADEREEPVALPLEPAAQVIALEEEAEEPAAPVEVKRRAGSHAARTPGKRAARRSTPARAAARPATTGPLVGSVLSPQTWRQALTAVSGRAS
jgi:flagellar protein FliO/FliZ